MQCQHVLHLVEPRAKQPFVFPPTSIQTVRQKTRALAITSVHFSSPFLLPETRSVLPFRGDLALPTLERRRELVQRTGELLRLSFLSVRDLRLQEAVIRGDERA